MKEYEDRELNVDIDLYRKLPYPNVIELIIGREEIAMCLSNQEIAYIVEQFAKGIK